MNVLNLPGFESLTSCFQSLLIVSAIGSVVVLIAIAFHMATSKWISSTWLYFFWFVVLFRFVLFVVPQSPTSLLNLVAQPATAISYADSDTQGINENEYFIFSSDSVVPIPIDEPTAGFRLSSSSNFWVLGAIVWLVVVGVLMSRLGLGYLHVKRLVNETSLPSHELDLRFERLKQRLGLRQRTRLRISNAIEVPAMAGLFNPVVILPAWCCRELDAEQLEMVFTHELIHIQRRDGLIQLVAHLIVVLHWFNPLARIAARFIESTRELSCDRRVIAIWNKERIGRAQSGSAAETLLIERKYGRTILEIAGRANSVSSVDSANNASQFSAAFMGGFTGSNQNLIKQRIAMLVSSKSQLWLRNIVAASCIALMLAVGFTSAQTICPPCPPVEVQVDAGHLLPMLPQEVVPVEQPVANALPGAPIYRVSKSGDAVLFDVPIASKQQSKPQPHSEMVILNAGEFKRISFDHQVPEIMVEDPAVVTATPVSPDEIRFTGGAPGKTEVHVFDTNRKAQLLKFHVVPDVRELKTKVEKEFPGVDVKIIGTTDGFVNLIGRVTTEQIAEIDKFVVANCNLPVRNQLGDTDPIAIKIKVYEVSKTKLKQLGIDWSRFHKDLPAEIKSLQSLLEGGRDGSNTLAFSVLEGGSFEEVIADLEKRKVASLLDQPKLVAQHGRVAEFFSGGEVPIAVINEKGQPTVEFRSYGTKIQATPLVHSKEEMTLEVRLEVSEVDKAFSTTTGIPGFRVRRINTGVRLKPCKTVALAGDFKNGKEGDAETTELVFLLTPRIIEKGSEMLTPNGNVKGPEFKLTREPAASDEVAGEKVKQR